MRVERCKKIIALFKKMFSFVITFSKEKKCTLDAILNNRNDMVFFSKLKPEVKAKYKVNTV